LARELIQAGAHIRKSPDDVLCLAPSEDCRERNHLLPPLVFEVRFNQIEKRFGSSTPWVQFLNVTACGQVLLEGQVPKLVDWLQFTIKRIVSGLH
jgi:hypothetical protein